MRFFKCLLVCGLGWIVLISGSKDPLATPGQARKIITDMLKSIENLKTLKYHLKCSERINGKMRPAESFIKLQRSPRKLYMKLNGPELLWIEGKNNGNALVNPNTFPYMNLNLDPGGSILRKDQHHTIHEIGFEYFADIIKANAKKAGDRFDVCFFYIGEEKWQGRQCHRLVISNPDFGFYSYTVKKGENIVSIARHLKVSEYMIMENNTHLKNYHDAKEGMTIRVPTVYAKQTTLLIDKQYNLPLQNMVLDDKGLFEIYEYLDLLVNVNIPEEEFDKNYKDYNF